jgi:hypothetical protein
MNKSATNTIERSGSKYQTYSSLAGCRKSQSTWEVTESATGFNLCNASRVSRRGCKRKFYAV